MGSVVLECHLFVVGYWNLAHIIINALCGREYIIITSTGPGNGNTLLVISSNLNILHPSPYLDIKFEIQLKTEVQLFWILQYDTEAYSKVFSCEYTYWTENEK